jgi:UDP-N-acetylmuramoylalanine--D-glutamate ligase
MISLPFAKDKHYAVMGLDKSGLPAVQALLAAGAKVTAWDDNPAQLEAARAAGAEIADLSNADAAAFEALVLTPGIAHNLPKPHPVAANFAGKPIICDIELFARSQPKARVVAVTGTDGKSTTTALIHHILQQANIPTAIGGNFGASPLARPDLPPEGVYVLELSSYQLERCPSLALDVAIWLNLTPDHLERHGDMAGYARAKANIFNNPKLGAVAIYGTDDKWTQTAGQNAQGFTQVPLVVVSCHVGIELLYLPALKGAHNRQNAIAAVEACRALGLSRTEIQTGLESFTGLPHRQQKVGTLGELIFINDSKATNANAASKALGTFDEIYWIAGGKPKASGLAGLESYIPRIRKAFLIGEAEAEFAAWCTTNSLSFERCGTLDKAVTAAVSAAQGRGVILLSPACASWDQFKSYEHRGELFTQLAQRYTAGQESAA